MFAILLSRRFDAGIFVRVFLMTVLAMVLMTYAAAAQAVAPVKVSLTPAWATLTPYVTAGVLGLAAWLTKAGNAFLAQHKLSAIQDDFDQALEHVPGLMTGVMASLAAHNTTLAVPAAISNVASVVIQMVPGIVTQLKFSPATVEAFVAAKLQAVGHPAVTAGAAPAVAKG